MTPAIKAFMLAISGSLAASIIAKVTVTTALGLIAAWLARGSRAAIRHALLASTFGVMLLLPILSFVVPPVHLAVQVVNENQGLLVFPPSAKDSEPILSEPIIENLENIKPVRRASNISWSNLLLIGWIIGWIIGGAIFLLPMVIGLWQIRLLRRSALPWPHGQSVADAIALEDRVRRRIEVLLHESVPGPMTYGIVHPAIILPQDAESWNEENLERAIVHELEHVRRGDSVSHCLSRAVCALYWFHPLVWIAWRKLVLEAERSCDDAVLRRSEATAYADQLVGLAKRLSVAQRSPILAMANRAELGKRVGAVLDARQRRGRVGIVALTSACTVAVVVVISMASLKLVASPQFAEQDFLPLPKNNRFEVVVVKPGIPGKRYGMHQSGDQFSLENYSLTWLIQNLYGTRGYNLVGMPKWASSETFSIRAKSERPTNNTLEYWAMLKPVIEERFKFKYHREKREMSAHLLSIDSVGIKFPASVPGACKPIDPNQPTPNLNPTGPPMNDCGRILGKALPLGGVQVFGKAISMHQIAGTLIQYMNGPVIDATNSTKLYDVDFSFDSGAPNPNPNGETSGLPPLSSALKKVGLSLKRGRGPVDVLIVDQLQRPSENTAQAEPAPVDRAVPAAAVPAKLEFDVASVKALDPVTPGTNGGFRVSGGPGTQDPGRIRYAQAPMLQILARAF